MADAKISQLTAATTPLDGTEVLPIVQSGATVKVANNNLRPLQIQSNATSGVLQVVGPAAATTRVMTVPNSNFTVARTDAQNTFSGIQLFTDTSAFGWSTNSWSGALRIGSLGTGGSLLIYTPSLSSSFGSGIGFDGTYDSGSFTSTLNIYAAGVRSGGPYNSQLDFYTSAATTLSAKMRITGGGNIYPLSATSTGMTNGFFYIPSAAGVPSGTPTSISGVVPMYYDSTNNRFYIYNGAWRSVALT